MARIASSWDIPVSTSILAFEITDYYSEHLGS
jgi:hypothetical protein